MVDKSETGLPRAVTIAWGMDVAPQRGPSRGLSHERIVAAGIEIADREGLAAVTMQAVARSLGFTTMSLYRYVASKEELLRLMQDAAVSVPATGPDPEGWQDRLRWWAGQIREAYRRHPWALEIPRGQHSVLMPHSIEMADTGLAALDGLALEEEAKIGVILVVSQLTASMVELELTLEGEGEVRPTAEGAALLGEVITAQRFPRVAPLYASGGLLGGGAPPEGVSAPGDPGVDAEFTLGLDLIIAGLEARHLRGGDPV